LFNCRLGVRRKDDVIPEMVPVPMTRGYVPKGESLQKALDEYYAIRGWNEDGVPTEAKIEQLGIENVAVPESYD